MHKLSRIIINAILLLFVISTPLFSASISGKIIFYPFADAEVSLVKEKLWGFNNSLIGTVKTKADGVYKFTGLEEGTYIITVSGPYVVTAQKKFRLTSYENLDLTLFQPYPSKSALIGIIYAVGIVNPDGLPSLVKVLVRSIEFHGGLTGCMQKMAGRAMKGSLESSNRDAYGRALNMWSPGMSTELPRQVANELQQASLGEYERARMLSWLSEILPSLVQGDTESFKLTPMYKECIMRVKLWNASLAMVMQQQKQLEQMQKIGGEWYKKLFGISLPKQSNGMTVAMLKKIDGMRIILAFFETHLLAKMVCP